MSFQNCKVTGTGVHPVKYHAKKYERGDPAHPVSPSMLRAAAANWSRWRNGYEPPDTEAKQWGNLLDCLETTPEFFKDTYAVKPQTYRNEKGEEKPWNGNANVCKTWLADHAGFEVISDETNFEAKVARIRLHHDEIIHAFSEASDKQVLVEGEWKDEDTGLTVPVRCLIDYVPRLDTEFSKCLGDLKTTRNGGLNQWQRWCATAGYHIQAAFDLDLYRAARPEEDRVTWCFILSENFPPYETGRRMLSDLEGQETMISLGRRWYQRALAHYCRCLKTNRWPGYDDNAAAVQGWSVVDPLPWMEYEELSETIEEQQEAANESNDITP